MKVLILGVDGYIGWALFQHLRAHGHEVWGIDSELRRKYVNEIGSRSAIPIHDFQYRNDGSILKTDIRYCFTTSQLSYDYDAIVHLAEQPSAPFSMSSYHRAIETQSNNVLGTLSLLWQMREACPNAHLIKLGTMGEYGTPECPIPEGLFPLNSYWIHSPLVTTRLDTDDYQSTGVNVTGDLSGMMFPRKAGSWYHLSKVHDTHNVEFACRNWGLRSTDIMQGVVYGSQTEEIKPYSSKYPGTRTRFDVDEYFGTVINRFCAQAVLGIPLTIYGKGGQTRGYLPLRDSVQCLRLAIENPPQRGEYRTFNQFCETYTINHLAMMVAEIGNTMGLNVESRHINNPRNESESHSYNVVHQKLFDLGYKPQGGLQSEIKLMLEDLIEHKSTLQRIPESVILPKTKWV